VEVNHFSPVKESIRSGFTAVFFLSEDPTLADNQHEIHSMFFFSGGRWKVEVNHFPLTFVRKVWQRGHLHRFGSPESLCDSTTLCPHFPLSQASVVGSSADVLALAHCAPLTHSLRGLTHSLTVHALISTCCVRSASDSHPCSPPARRSALNGRSTPRDTKVPCTLPRHLPFCFGVFFVSCELAHGTARVSHLP
jgi:hypothetical protein